MPFTVQQLIESHQEPVTVSPQDTIQKALTLMAEYDFSQLPVVDEDNKPLVLLR
ncbi:MAG: CBS domain-containing protein [Ktedonobacteraceae bacterium]